MRSPPCDAKRLTDRPQSTRAGVLIPFAIVTLIWGSTWLIIRDQISIVPPAWSVSYRFAIAGLAMAGYAVFRGESLRLPPRGLGFAAIIGIAQFCLNFNFVYRAEGFITSGLVAVIFGLLMVPNAVLGRIFLGQRLGRQLIAGSLVAICGIALLFIHEVRSDPHGPEASLIGIGLTFCAILSASSANVLQATKTARAYPMIPTLAIAMLIGAAIDALFALAMAGPPVVEWRWGYAAGILYLALAASALAFPLYFQVIRTIGPAKAAYSGVIVPVIAMLLSTTFEGYRWSLLAGAGAVLTGIGLVIALTARRPAR
ncbi:MAG TPA: DMT family transporter [Sphingomonas sp.]|jgi:drug/metabolite transporter (DMT)-like permease|nr:DMT family transporter [Sphingomonas sp.]